MFYATFDSFADLLVGNLGLSISGMGVPASMSTTGLAFDGEQYIVQFEEDVDSAVDEVFYATFDSFADLLVGNLGLSISGMGVPASMSTTGLAFDGSIQPTSVSEPPAAFLLCAGLTALAACMRRRIPTRRHGNAA